MLDVDTLTWRDQLVLSREITVPGERSAFYNSLRRGEYVALRRGAFMRTELWKVLTPDEQYRFRALAAMAVTAKGGILSHQSAVAMWRLPWFGGWPRAIHILDGVATGGRSDALTRRHSGYIRSAPEWIDGVAVTSLERTVIDIATSATFEQSVVVADAALRRADHPVAGVPAVSVTKEVLRNELSQVAKNHGTAKGARAIEFANGLADRPGESLSRVTMSLARLTAPVLQREVRGASGRRWIVDFWWPEFNVIGEFDGKAKYTNPEFLRARTPEQALRDEKDREDDLRAMNHRVSRWGWEKASSVPLLRAQLIAAGVR